LLNLLNGAIKNAKPRGWLSVALVSSAALVCAPSAMANTTKSANWAGYAVHRPGVSFHVVSATWTQPTAACVAGQQSYSAVWVGLGGYKVTSDALEQVGTEVDCNAAGQVKSSAWYELVPAPSKTISLAVHPGDLMHATVTVSGNNVVVDLQDLTRHRTFRRELYSSEIDVSSAEWIVEAPSECVSQFSCQALPLADFGSVSFNSATALSVQGTAGSILDHNWGRTKIKLTPGSPRFVVYGRPMGTAGAATPSSLESGGTQFEVNYSAVSIGGAETGSVRRLAAQSAYLRH
jgi:hypothetical protein